jgi:hypothetical protein
MLKREGISARYYLAVQYIAVRSLKAQWDLALLSGVPGIDFIKVHVARIPTPLSPRVEY